MRQNNSSFSGIRVLHVFGILNRGGAEMRTIALQKNIISQNIKFDYLALTGQVGVLDAEVVSLGSKVHHVSLTAGFPLKLFRILRQNEYDVVHSHVALSSALILLIAAMAGVKGRVAHFRNVKTSETRSFVRKVRDFIFTRILYWCSTDIAGVCKGALDGYWGKRWGSDKKFQVIYNGFVKTEINRSADFWSSFELGKMQGPVFVNVARMDPVKNHGRVVEIFKKYRDTYTTGHLVLVGKEDSEILRKLDEYIELHRLEDYVHYLNIQNNPLELMANSDVMLFPSFWEGLPGVVIESCSVGTPVVATRLPGTEEISQELEGVTLLSLVETDIRWAEALHAQWCNGRVGSNVDFDSTLFSMDKCVRQVIKLYKKYA